MEAATRVPSFMTLQEFLGWDAPWGPPWQLVDGVPQAMAPGSRTHNSLMVELSALLRNHFVGRALPCSVLANPGVVPRVRANINYRIPDLAVTCSSCREEECYLDDPVLLVEILSPSNAPETWTNIWAYTSIPSLQEILILRSTQVGAELLRRDAAGNWPAEAMTIEAGMLELTSIDFQVELAAIYRDTRFAAG
jgi:Uma2 family endonuclease